MFNFPEGHRYRLERPPLVLALAQARFPLIAHLHTMDGVAPVQDQLRTLFPYMEVEEIQEIELPFGSPSNPTVANSKQWVFTNDTGTKLNLAAGAATLIKGKEYESLSAFASEFKQILDALAAVERIRRCDRLGVRYLSAAETPPGQESAWKEWFRPELIGWAGDNVLSEQSRLNSFITESRISVPGSSILASLSGDVQGLVRHGLVPRNALIRDLGTAIQSPSYIIDFDLFAHFPQRFDAEMLSEEFVALQLQIARFFRWSLTARGEEYFGLEELESDGGERE
jgi:uncharacterized protein (TIGR04255 family)